MANKPTGQSSRLSNIVGQASRLSDNFWKRHLPHIQLSSGHYYFITFSTQNRKLLSAKQKDCVFNGVRFLNNKKYELIAVVVLDDHVHIIINPLEPLPKIMHSIKSFTAHAINKMSNSKGTVWLNENYDRVIRDENELLEKINYIANNPIKANLAKEIASQNGYPFYKWLYIKGWIEND